ncbi:hypothetical protein DY000_02060909 [Brassica cretica]|uniref:Cytochrome P450 n=1 Tax=Brassica cretica TaxID=69181 RepID=A0ABQ7B191_BRACR|nr:hypothetical protein DY000_02060909 [Brassica cretica]
MEISNVMFLLASVAAYWLWFKRISRWLKGPGLWPVLGSLPGLIEQRDRMHKWITENFRACGGAYQTCTCAVYLLARKQGFVNVTCDQKNLEHMLKTRFDNFRESPTWHNPSSTSIRSSYFQLQRHLALEFTSRLKPNPNRLICKTWYSASHLITFSDWRTGSREFIFTAPGEETTSFAQPILHLIPSDTSNRFNIFKLSINRPPTI